jgi:hypothetical protein
MRLPLRSLLATAAAATVLAYGATGHSVPQVNSHDGMAGSTIGLCLLLVTVLGLVALPQPEGRPRPIRTLAVAAPEVVLGPPALDGRARASPSSLQRFLN